MSTTYNPQRYVKYDAFDRVLEFYEIQGPVGVIGQAEFVTHKLVAFVPCSATQQNEYPLKSIKEAWCKSYLLMPWNMLTTALRKVCFNH